MERIVITVSVATLFLNILAQPAKADTGDTAAMLVAFLIAFVFLCAGLGVYARKYDEGYKI
jgi:hypothetical protein